MVSMLLQIKRYLWIGSYLEVLAVSVVVDSEVRGCQNFEEFVVVWAENKRRQIGLVEPQSLQSRCGLLKHMTPHIISTF